MAILCIDCAFVLDLLGGAIIELIERLEVGLWTDWVLVFKPDKEILCGDAAGGDRMVLLVVKTAGVRVEFATREAELEWDVYNVCVTLMDVPDTPTEIETLPTSELLSIVGRD